MYIVLGAIVLIVVVLVLKAWYGKKARQGDPPPEITHEASGPPEERSQEWDPRDRYE